MAAYASAERAQKMLAAADIQAGSAEELVPLLVREHSGVLWEAQTDFAHGTGVLQNTAGLVEEFSQALAKGIELCRELGNSETLRPFAAREVMPGGALPATELAEFVRNGATTYFHETGTCRMGRDSDAVVDPHLRVNGVQNLRVADASIMPRMAGVATMASCVLIGERMSEILGVYLRWSCPCLAALPATGAPRLSCSAVGHSQFS